MGVASLWQRDFGDRGLKSLGTPVLYNFNFILFRLYLIHSFIQTHGLLVKRDLLGQLLGPAQQQSYRLTIINNQYRDTEIQISNKIIQVMSQ